MQKYAMTNYEQHHNDQASDRIRPALTGGRGQCPVYKEFANAINYLVCTMLVIATTTLACTILYEVVGVSPVTIQ